MPLDHTQQPEEAKGPRWATDGSDSSEDDSSSVPGALPLPREGHRTKKIFPYILHDILDSAEEKGIDHIVSWMPCGQSFKVHDRALFVKEILPQAFRLTKYKSYSRQLNLYYFTFVASGGNQGAYFHPQFLRGDRDLCKYVRRRDTTAAGRASEKKQHKPVQAQIKPTIGNGTISSSDSSRSDSPAHLENFGSNLPVPNSHNDDDSMSDMITTPLLQMFNIYHGGGLAQAIGNCGEIPHPLQSQQEESTDSTDCDEQKPAPEDNDWVDLLGELHESGHLDPERIQLEPVPQMESYPPELLEPRPFPADFQGFSATTSTMMTI